MVGASTADQEHEPVSRAWRFYINLYAGTGVTIAFSTALILAQVAMSLPIAVLLKRAFDSAVAPSGLSQIAVLAVALPALYLIGDALLLTATGFNLRVTKSVILRLRETLIEAAYLMPRIHSPASQIGRIHAALIHDTERIDNMSNSLLSRILPSVLSAAGLLVVLAWLSWRLFLVAALLVPACWGTAQVLNRPLRQRIERFRTAFESFCTDALAVLQRQELARIHGADRDDINIMINHSRNVNDAGYQVAWISTAHGLLQGEGMVIVGMLVLLAGGTFIASGTLTVGTLIACYFALGLLRSHLSVLFAQIPVVVAGNAALQHLHRKLLDSEPNAYSGIRRVDFRGEVALERVSFGYEGKHTLLEASLLVRPGEITALAGANGAGKTTVAHLMLGLVRPKIGRLLADGVPYDDLAFADLRRGVGYASQDPIIFAGSVRDNLMFGANAACADFLQSALDIAGASEFVAGLPSGLDTWLGEGGARLSGGQRQRLAIARAALRRPALLILDEPTNHIGTAETRAVLNRFRPAFPRAAILVISHDPEILCLADRVYLLDGGTMGEIVPAGPVASRVAP